MDWGRDRAKISYSKVAAAKYKALEMVFDALGFLSDSSFDRFREDNQDWLENYALFAAIYEQFQYLPLPLWGDGVARRSHAELDRLRIRLDRRIRFYEYLQYLFYGQWGQLRRYAAQKGVWLMGSMTFELPETSVELWTDPAANDVELPGAPLPTAGSSALPGAAGSMILPRSTAGWTGRRSLPSMSPPGSQPMTSARPSCRSDGPLLGIWLRQAAIPMLSRRGSGNGGCPASAPLV